MGCTHSGGHLTTFVQYPLLFNASKRYFAEVKSCSCRGDNGFQGESFSTFSIDNRKSNCYCHCQINTIIVDKGNQMNLLFKGAQLIALFFVPCHQTETGGNPSPWNWLTLCSFATFWRGVETNHEKYHPRDSHLDMRGSLLIFNAKYWIPVVLYFTIRKMLTASRILVLIWPETFPRKHCVVCWPFCWKTQRGEIKAAGFFPLILFKSQTILVSKWFLVNLFGLLQVNMNMGKSLLGYETSRNVSMLLLLGVLVLFETLGCMTCLEWK